MVEIVWEEFGLVRTLTGVITTEEMDTSAQRIQAHPQLDEMRYSIHDFSGVTEALLDDDDIEFLAVRASISLQRNPRIRLSFVGTHPVVHKLIEAFNNSGCSKHRIRRFDTLEEARRYSAGSRSI